MADVFMNTEVSVTNMDTDYFVYALSS